MTFGRDDAHADPFSVVFNLHHSYVYGLVRALLGGSAQDAEDVTQEVFLRVYKALPGYDPERASMRTWLTTITVNTCNSQRKRLSLRRFRQQRSPSPGEDAPELEVADLSTWGAPEEQALQGELRQIIKGLLLKLKVEHRTVLVLHYYLDYSAPEIARILGCPEGTVYSRLHYARRLIQAQLESDDVKRET